MKASDLLSIAAKQLGVSESPPSSNNVRYNTWFYGREVRGSAYPWCMVFCQWVFAQAGVSLPVRTASCGALMYAAEKAGKWVRSGYRPGDLVIFNFPGGAATDHCGIVEKVTVDENGVVCPKADNRLLFAAEGAAEVITTDAGDPRETESFARADKKALSGMLVCCARSIEGKPGSIKITATADGLAPAQVELVAE